MFLRRQQALSYHRESYRNLVRTVQPPPTHRAALAAAIRAVKELAERDWLPEKLR